MHGEAKESAEIANEKEVIDRAVIQSIGKNKYGNLEQEELQDELNKITGDEKTEISDNGEKFEVVFVDSNRYYTVDKNGNIVEEGKIVVDKSPGDITKDENGNNLKGDESEPYEIWCIEDLVEWSQNYSNYSNSYINLERTLNFKSKLSYTNSERTDYGDLNEDNTIDFLIQEMQTGKGFKPIAMFSGRFNGKDYRIDNIYIDYTGTSENVGLFSNVQGAQISNLEISGNISGNCAGGIIGYLSRSTTVVCENIINNCNIHAEGKGAGGIVGYFEYGKELKIINCGNTGNIFGDNAGGIVGYAYAPNSSSNQEVYIYNSFNQGAIEAELGNAGGIIGWLNSDVTGYGNGKIYNCYNTGKIITMENISQTDGKTGGIYGLFRSMVASTLEIKNSYILSDLNLKVGTSGWSCLVNGEKIVDDYINAKFLEKSYMQSQDFLNELNTFVLEGEELKNWIMGENGYPTFE